MAVGADRDSGRILVVTGLALEARIAAGPHITTLCSGGDPLLLRSRLAATGPRGLRAVISFGLAGGLDPTLRPGDVVVASEVTSGADVWQADRAVVQALRSRV